MKIPWNEEVAVVRQPPGGGEREQVHQCTLWLALEWIRYRPDRSHLLIFLPDRRVAPLSFDQEQIGDLLLSIDRQRQLDKGSGKTEIGGAVQLDARGLGLAGR